MTVEYVHSYHTRDKTAWPDGPWQNEIDKAQWVDEETGLDCLIVRNRVGGLCGYVGVGPEHPWYGKDYSTCTLDEHCVDEDGYPTIWCSHTPEGQVSVHGGLTYSDFCMTNAPESEGICHIPLEGRPENIYWLGFDCVHFGDRMPTLPNEYTTGAERYRTEEYVQEQCASLAKQLAEVESL